MDPVEEQENPVPEQEMREEVAPEESGGDPALLTPLGIGSGLALVLVVLFSVMVVLRRSGEKDYKPTLEQLSTDEVPLSEVPDGEAPATTPAPPVGLVSLLNNALGRSRAALAERFDQIFTKPVDDALFEELEEALIIADVGYETSTGVIARLKERVAAGESDSGVLRAALREELREILTPLDTQMSTAPESGPWVLLVVGVNGSGKTTTIGKLAARFHGEGKKVMLAAADTFRAAAAEQLEVWAGRANAEFVSHAEGADPAAVAFEALDTAAARGCDVVIVDTAGRLQTRKPLMEQLAKIRRVIAKKVPGGPHETLLVVDGTMGQNALSQAKLFHEATPLTGVAVTKLDGTAKGGMILTIASELSLPVKLIGIGEGIDDLKDFDADAFIEVLA